jgi:hypothetical protein
MSNMKKIGFIAVLAGLLFTSCGDSFIERSPISNMNEMDFYKTEADFNTALMAVYQTFHTIYGAQGPVSYFGEQMSDNGTLTAHTGTQGDYFDFRDHTLKVSNSLVLTYWNNFYQSLYRVNTFLDKIQSADFEHKAVYEGEARFIRGLYYFLMVQMWGDVPLVTKPLNVDESYNTGRTPVEQVYEQIISDLDFAAKTLPAKTNVSEAGRISSEAAFGILAKVYLTRNTGNDKSLAQAALMNIYQKQGFALVNNYEDLWVISNKNTSEAVFEIQYEGGAGNPYSSYWRLFSPFENHGGYFLNGKYKDKELHAAGGGDNQVTDDLWNAYEPDDLRRDVSIADGWKTISEVINPTRFPIKWVDLDAPRVNEAELCDNNFIVLRYADVLLLLAEVTGDAKYLNEVRDRAGLPKWGDAAYPTSLYPTLELAIEHERQVELALEFHRYFDLKRSGRAASVLAASSKGITNPKLVLPIPLTVVTQNPDVITQNSGY